MKEPFVNKLIMSSMLIFSFSTLLCASSITMELSDISHMSDEHWQAINDLWISSFADAYRDLPYAQIDNGIQGDDQQALIDWLQRLFIAYRVKMTHYPYTLAKAHQDGHLVGYALYHVVAGTNIIHIDHLAVDPKCQGRGIGKDLLNKVAQGHPECNAFVLTTRILNMQARKFYKKQGFHELQEHIKNVDCNPLYSVMLKKDLA